jgi:hypothetical protein
MGEPKFTDNVRRIDFAKAAKPRARAEDSSNKTESVRSSRERLKVVSLPEPRNRRRPRGQRTPQSVLMAIIVILAALLGALIAAIVLDPSL